MKTHRKKADGTGIDRRRFLKGVGGTAAAVALAPPRKAPAQSKGLTLKAIIHLYPPTGAVQGLLPAYEKETGIKVVFDQIPFGEGYAKQMAELVTGGARYDMLTPWSFWSNGEIGTGQLEVLDDYVAKAGPALDWNDIIPVQRDLFKYAGHQYGVPISSQTFLLAYRHDIYSAAGLTPPRDGVLTSDAFAANVKKLHKFQKDVHGMVWHHKPVAAAAMSWAIMFNAAGGRWFDERLNPLFNSPTAALVTEYYTKEIIPYMPPDVLTYGNTERDETYQRGALANPGDLRSPTLQSPGQDDLRHGAVQRTEWHQVRAESRGGRGLGLRDQQEQQAQEGGLRLHRLGLDQREAEAHGARIGDRAQPRIGPGRQGCSRQARLAGRGGAPVQGQLARVPVPEDSRVGRDHGEARQ
ncbi:MAG: carbohydrate ABC transporter substrate-binding protein [candidate division NC10 bacterium]|nr:carbohydrate ABC transporter substrate-binding protein [candidate division NC10 bacterium]